MILNHPTFSESEVKLLVSAAREAYNNQASLSGWNVITPDLTNYGLSPNLILGNAFTRQAPDGGDANATLFKSGNTLLLAFRGTEFQVGGDPNYWLQMPAFYQLFTPLFQALDNYTQANPSSKILVTGHSLGAAMTELFMENHPGNLYSAVSVASPLASNESTDSRILNIGHENDLVYEIVYELLGIGGGANPNNATTNLNIAVGTEHQIGMQGISVLDNHSINNYIYSIERIFNSSYYQQMQRDSLIIIDRTDNETTEITNLIANSPTKNAFILGENDDNDLISGLDGNDVIEALGGNDTLFGEFRAFISSGGNDTLDGGAGNDSLDGGNGDGDTAIFSDDFQNYDIDTISGGLFGGITTTIDHARGTQTDGVDTLKNIEFAQFDDGIASLPLEDGVAETTIGSTIFSGTNPSDLNKYGRLSQTLPISMLDGNAEYTVNFSAIAPDTQYNIAYIIDVSASMNATELQAAKDSYINLTNYFINNGLAENINFGVVSFSRNATLYDDLTANQAISRIQSLTNAPAIEGTRYNAALQKGLDFFTQSPLRGATNLALFTSDGRSQHNFADPNDVSYVFDAINLRNVANVQAFGLFDSTDPGTISQSQIDFVDSDNGVILNNANQLQDALSKSGLVNILDRIELLKEGEVVETILPNQLTDTPLGLSFTGTIDNLDVSLNAENIITAKAYFTNGTAPATLDFTVASGLEETTGDPLTNTIAGTAGDDTILLNQIDLGANGDAGNDRLVGNKYSNNLNGGEGKDTIIAHEGNDNINPGNGLDRIDGGDGIDTVVYENLLYANSFLNQTGNITVVDSQDNLDNVEFIQYSDFRISTETLEITPTLQSNDVTVTETKTGTTTAQFTFNLSTPAPVDVQFTYQTVDGDAIASEDYIAKTGQVTILAGDTTATVEVEVIGDTQYDESTEVFGLNLSAISGATFVKNEAEYAVSANIENRPEDLNLIGDTGQNTLIGGQGNDSINGKEDNDYLAGEGGDDTLIGGAGIGIDTLIGSSGNDTLNGGDGNDSLEGQAGNDTLNGGAGNDSLIGGIDNDKYIVNATGDILTETSNIPTEIDSVESSITYTLGNNLENLTLIGSAIINGTGNNLNNAITGNNANNTLDGADGNDTLNGGAGNDTMIGGIGNDSYIVDAVGDMVTETSTTATEIDTVESSVTYTLGNNLENLTLTGTAIIDATGNSLNNILTGNSLNNTLNGALGNDTMIGGAGNDTYLVNIAGDVVTESSNNLTEIDTVRSQITYTLGDNLENLVLTGTNAINATGNSLNNNLTGNSANNTLNGGEGNDTLNGSTGNDTMLGSVGNDTYVVNATGDIVTETSTIATEIDSLESTITYTLGNNLENLTLTGTGVINGTGNNLNNFITGNSADNTLNGGDGNDTLNGNTGNDSLVGGNGNDTYLVDAVGDMVTETSTNATEIDTVESAVTYTLGNNLENLILTGTGVINGTGNSFNNIFTGNSADNTLNGGDGNDILNGSTGNDSLVGGIGNDTYLIDAVGDMVTETSTTATEIDTVESNITYTLGNNLENLTLTGTSIIDGTGNSLNNLLIGNSGHNILNGSSGNDTMIGGGGNDTYLVNIAEDIVTETSNIATEIDTVRSQITYTLGDNLENLILTGASVINGTGNSQGNNLTGNSANNNLNGGAGNDTLIGNAGSDRFIYDTNAAFTTAAVGVDLITDFTKGSDKIVLDKTTFTSLTSIAGNGFGVASEFAVVSDDGAASSSNALIVYSSGSGNLFYNQNGTNADFGTGGQFDILSGIPALAADDFVIRT
jgi:Ca2+-binding RTX toxin-like protein